MFFADNEMSDYISEAPSYMDDSAHICLVCKNILGCNVCAEIVAYLMYLILLGAKLIVASISMIWSVICAIYAFCRQNRDVLPSMMLDMYHQICYCVRGVFKNVMFYALMLCAIFGAFIMFNIILNKSGYMMYVGLPYLSSSSLRRFDEF